MPLSRYGMAGGEVGATVAIGECSHKPHSQFNIRVGSLPFCRARERNACAVAFTSIHLPRVFVAEVRANASSMADK
jgi:hypothetical protein